MAEGTAGTLAPDRVLAGLRASCPDLAAAPAAANAWQFLVGIILLRGSTVLLVDQIAAVLHEHHADPVAVAALPTAGLTTLLKRLPFAREKSRAVVEAARHLCVYHRGQVPIDVDDLAWIPGLGRTGAARMLAEYYGRPAIAAEAPVRRILHRWGWCVEDGIEKTEQAVAHCCPSSTWIELVARLRQFAVDPCRRGVPVCSTCPFDDGCPKRGVEERR